MNVTNSRISVYTSDGPLRFVSTTYRDGQPHVELVDTPPKHGKVYVEASIQSPDDLFRVQLLASVLSVRGSQSTLNVRYLMGARMDRAINERNPFTLDVVASTILRCGFDRVRVLDPHSDVTCQLLFAQAVLPTKVVGAVLAQYHPERTVVVAPDKGAERRTRMLVEPHGDWHVRQALKERDPQTREVKILGVEDASFFKQKRALIVDDLCDGGRTFTGLAEVLLAAGAVGVDLYVTHGIFSNGLPLQHIDRVFTTDSYERGGDVSLQQATVFPVRMAEM